MDSRMSKFVRCVSPDDLLLKCLCPTLPYLKDLYLNVAAELDSEGRNLVFNAIANQLRYPNSHTFYFSCVLLGLFSEVKVRGGRERGEESRWGGSGSDVFLC